MIKFCRGNGLKSNQQECKFCYKSSDSDQIENVSPKSVMTTEQEAQSKSKTKKRNWPIRNQILTGKDEKNERKEVWNRSEQNERNVIFLEGGRIEKERKTKVRKMRESWIFSEKFAAELCFEEKTMALIPC